MNSFDEPYGTTSSCMVCCIPNDDGLFGWSADREISGIINLVLSWSWACC